MAERRIGLDIGTSAVRAAEVELSGGRPRLVTFGQVGLPPGALTNGEVHDRTAVVDALRRLWQQGNFSSSKVVVGIAGLRAITRSIDLPYIPDDEVDGAVRFQSEDIIPFPLELTALSSQVIGDYTTKDGQQMRRVLVAAAHKDMVDAAVQAVLDAGLQPVGVDLGSFALVRGAGDASVSEGAEAIVSIGAGLTVVVVQQLGRPLFVRTVAHGGNAATEAISSTLDLPFNDAEALKRRLGDQATQVAAPQTTQVVNAVSGTVRDLVAEIRNSIQFFSSQPGQPAISRVVVTGGSSLLEGVMDALQAQVGLPVFRASPASRVEMSPEQVEQVDPVLATPLGLVLPPPSGSRPVNLLPEHVREAAQEKTVRRWAYAAVALFVVVLAGLGAWRLVQVHDAENTVGSLKSQVASLNAQVPKYNAAVRVADDLKTEQSLFPQVLTNDVDWLKVMTQLVATAPAGTSLSSFSGSDSVVSSTTGSGTSNAATSLVGTITVAVVGPSLATAAQWLGVFGASPYFANPTIASISAPGQGQSVQVGESFSSTVNLRPSLNTGRLAAYTSATTAKVG